MRMDGWEKEVGKFRKREEKRRRKFVLESSSSLSDISFARGWEWKNWENSAPLLFRGYNLGFRAGFLGEKKRAKTHLRRWERTSRDERRSKEDSLSGINGGGSMGKDMRGEEMKKASASHIGTKKRLREEFEKRGEEGRHQDRMGREKRKDGEKVDHHLLLKCSFHPKNRGISSHGSSFLCLILFHHFAPSSRLWQVVYSHWPLLLQPYSHLSSHSQFLCICILISQLYGSASLSWLYPTFRPSTPFIFSLHNNFLILPVRAWIFLTLLPSDLPFCSYYFSPSRIPTPHVSLGVSHPSWMNNIRIERLSWTPFVSLKN